MTPHHHEKRIDALRASLKQCGCDVFFSLDPADNAYLTGFFGSTSTVVIAADQAWLFCDFRYREQAAAQVTAAEVMEFSGSQEAFLAQRLSEGKYERAACDPEVTTVARWNAVKAEYRGALVESPGICRKLREVKEPGEIERIRAASLLAEDALEAVLKELKPGMREVDLAGRLEYEFRLRGAQGASFDTIALFGENSSLPHGKPGVRTLSQGDIVLVDCGCILDGYCSDLTRTFVFGTIPGDWFAEVYECVRLAQADALSTVHSGAAARAVDGAARMPITRAGHGAHFGHGTGHGLGLEVHESPRLNEQSKAILAAGMVVTVEPGIYLPGQGGVRIEDLLVVTDSGSLVLTEISKELRIL